MTTTEGRPNDGHSGLSDPAPTGQLNGPVRDTGAQEWQRRVWMELGYRPLPSLAIALVVGILAAALTAGLLLRGTTVWTSETTMIIDDPYGIALAGDGGQIAKLAELRIKYANLASTYAIAQPVAQRLHVPVGVVLGATHVDVPTDSLLMSVVGQWSSAADAQKLSSALAQGISDYVKTENQSNGIPAQDQFAAVAVSPTSPATSSGPSSTRAALAALGVFVGAAVIVFVLAQLFAVRRLRFPA